MKPNRKLLFEDLMVVAFLIVAIYYWNRDTIFRFLWGFLFVYTLVKQLYNHYTYYKDTGKYY